VPRYTNVVLVILDGLRPDAVRPTVMPALAALARERWQAAHAVTVRPSVTVAALTSLATGVSPDTHGLIEPGFRALGMFAARTLLPNHLRRNGHRVTIVTTDLPPASLVVARTLLGIAGAVDLIGGGTRPVEVADRAVVEASRPGPALTVVYFNDCDRAGHAEGWMSPWYLSEAARLDDAIHRLAPLADREDTLLIVTADHGGGGIVPHDHDGDHPLNLRIPIILAGGGVHTATRSQTPAHLLDLPPTILAALGVPVPADYEGRVLTEAFVEEEQTAVA
jgi:predicted AlkP superfamily pyrophosphatase or phosphodiesterase